MPVNIRPATPDDIPEILALIRELADYEREPQAAVATAEDLMRDGFREPKRFHCLMAEIDRPDGATAVAGFALYFYSYSTWRGHAGIYLEDLFVRPVHRGTGIGKALLASVAAVAVTEGCPRLEWAVLDWNKPAIDFYDSVGAVGMTEWTTMRVSGEELQALASAAPEAERLKASAGA
jgi:GNAT superfamily N-acetyltransferase